MWPSPCIICQPASHDCPNTCQSLLLNRCLTSYCVIIKRKARGQCCLDSELQQSLPAHPQFLYLFWFSAQSSSLLTSLIPEVKVQPLFPRLFFFGNDGAAPLGAASFWCQKQTEVSLSLEQREREAEAHLRHCCFIYVCIFQVVHVVITFNSSIMLLSSGSSYVNCIPLNCRV